MNINPPTTATKRKRVTPSGVVAVAFVAAAGLIAWFGVSGEKPTAAAVPELVSIAQAEEPQAAAVRRVSTGGLPTRIVVPSASVDAPIAEVGVVLVGGRAKWETAWKAAGHHIDSALPGQPGNMVITGHVSVADRKNLAVFSQLDNVSAGDIVEVYAGDQVFRYSVDKVAVVPPSAVKLLRSGMGATVTLVTCTADLKNRLVVTATLQG